VSVRAHIGSGTVYLSPGWTNVDLPAARCLLAADRPDLVEAYATTPERYYARHQEHNTVGSFASGPGTAPYLCDCFGRWDCLPFRAGEVVELLARQSFEHLSQREAHAALAEVRRVLVAGGVLRLSVPDHEAGLKAYRETGDPVMARVLLGPRNCAEGYHLQSYTYDTLRELVEGHGFAFVEREPNLHSYPSLCLVWRKVGA